MRLGSERTWRASTTSNPPAFPGSGGQESSRPRWTPWPPCRPRRRSANRPGHDRVIAGEGREWSDRLLVTLGAYRRVHLGGAHIQACPRWECTRCGCAERLPFASAVTSCHQSPLWMVERPRREQTGHSPYLRGWISTPPCRPSPLTTPRVSGPNFDSGFAPQGAPPLMCRPTSRPLKITRRSLRPRLCFTHANAGPRPDRWESLDPTANGARGKSSPCGFAFGLRELHAIHQCFPAYLPLKSLRIRSNSTP